MFFRASVVAAAIALVSQLSVATPAPSPQLMRPKLHVYDVIESAPMSQRISDSSASRTTMMTLSSELGSTPDDYATSSSMSASVAATDTGTSFIAQSNSGGMTANAGMGAVLLAGSAILTVSQVF